MADGGYTSECEAVGSGQSGETIFRLNSLLTGKIQGISRILD